VRDLAAPAFVPAPGLHSPHWQTVYASVLRKPRFPAGLKRERWDTPDGDFIDVDVLPARLAGAPHVLLLHGLEGSTDGGYIRESLRLVAAQGWGAYALNFRGCSGTPNRSARSYCSGDTDDALFVLQRMPEGPRFAMGFSLGGNVLLKLLAERHDDARVAAADAISVPFDLAECARRLDAPEPWMRFYQFRFLRTLKAKALEKSPRFPQHFDRTRIRGVRSIIAFDDVVTAPLYGLNDAADYYAWASSGPRLHAIRTRTLVITSQDDPLAPASLLPETDNPSVHRLVTSHGGHVGFVAGSLLKPSFWAEQRAIEFLRTSASG
jgi:predicted alpha/beta-fold hydrolase